MNSNFEADYRREQENIRAYKSAKIAGDEPGMENARAAHNELMKAISEKGSTYQRIYREYEISMESGNELLDLNDCIWDKEVESLIHCLRENGIERFTFSSTWSSAVETAWLFTKNGCTLEGLVEINSRHKNFMTDEFEKAHGYLFRLA